jgi:hypothetical protein
MKACAMQYIRVRQVPIGERMLARILPTHIMVTAVSTCTRTDIGLRLFSDKKVDKADDGPKIKQAKAKKKDKSKQKDDGSGKSKEYNLVVAALDAPIKKEPPISEEERARRHEIGRSYNIGRFRFHNQVNQDLTNKIHLKKHAINMLPRNSKMKEEAMKENDESPPPWQSVPGWTPPITNFDLSQYISRDDEK